MRKALEDQDPSKPLSQKQQQFQDYQNKVNTSLNTCDNMLQYSQRSGNIKENPLFSLGNSDILKIEQDTTESICNGKQLMINRLNVKRQSPLLTNQNINTAQRQPMRI